MTKLQVLIVNGSVVARRLLSDAVACDPLLAVSGIAANGKLAFAKLEQSVPDAVLLDVDLPDLDGLAVLSRMVAAYPHLPIIIVSCLAERGSGVALEALSRGAKCCVRLPKLPRELDRDMQGGAAEVIASIKRFVRMATPKDAALNQPSRINEISPLHPLKADANRVDAVVIGASTGGPDALTVILRSCPASFPVPIVIVQHMPANFTPRFADRLDAQLPLRVAEARSRMAIHPGQIWLAPGDYHLALARHQGMVELQTHQGQQENSCRPSVDVLFRSAAAVYGSGCLAVVLTGMGRDGLAGCRAVRDAGGQILVQDEASSVVWGMPGFVARMGLADAILPLDQLGGEIVRRALLGRPRRSSRL